MLLANDYSLLTTYYSLLTAHYSLLTTHYSPYYLLRLLNPNPNPNQEKLDEENAWYCPKCKELRQGTKQMQFWSALVT